MHIYDVEISFTYLRSWWTCFQCWATFQPPHHVFMRLAQLQFFFSVGDLLEPQFLVPRRGPDLVAESPDWRFSIYILTIDSPLHYYIARCHLGGSFFHNSGSHVHNTNTRTHTHPTPHMVLFHTSMPLFIPALCLRFLPFFLPPSLFLCFCHVYTW